MTSNIRLGRKGVTVTTMLAHNNDIVLNHNNPTMTTSAVTDAPNTVSDEENRIDNINLDEDRLA